MLEVRSVIFDLDGVITNKAKYHYIAWKKLCDEIGLNFNEEMNESLKGIDRVNSLELILKMSDKNFSQVEKNMLLDKKNQYYLKYIQKMNKNDILPGTIDLLNSLRKMNIKIGLASVSRNAFSVLSSLGIKGLFNYIVDAERLKNTKPHPEIFLVAADNLNVPYDRCIGVDDSVAGIKSINSAGMYSVGVGDRNKLNEANDIIEDLSQFNINKYVTTLN